MKKLTCKKAKYFLKDEQKASKEYSSYGFKKLSKDESSHAKFFKKKLRGRC